MDQFLCRAYYARACVESERTRVLKVRFILLAGLDGRHDVSKAAAAPIAIIAAPVITAMAEGLWRQADSPGRRSHLSMRVCRRVRTLSPELWTASSS